MGYVNCCRFTGKLCLKIPEKKDDFENFQKWQLNVRSWKVMGFEKLKRVRILKNRVIHRAVYMKWCRPFGTKKRIISYPDLTLSLEM